MTEIKRTRQRAAPVEPVEGNKTFTPVHRRVRPAPVEDDDEMDVSVPAPSSRLSGYGKGEVVTIVLRVKATVLEGNIHGGDFENWFRSALHTYHSQRGGKVGYSELGVISSPVSARIDRSV